MWITDVKSSNSTLKNKGSILLSQIFSKSTSDCSNLKPYRCSQFAEASVTPIVHIF